MTKPIIHILCSLIISVLGIYIIIYCINNIHLTKIQILKVMWKQYLIIFVLNIVNIIKSSGLAENAKSNSIKIFNRLAKAEAAVHGTTIDKIQDLQKS